jgi:2-dehydro-3-deoxyphosphogluconate aldolase/(4S)-4-hydroxy-2-oxoglutarate aldolase
MNIRQIMQAAPVIPVLVIDDPQTAVPLCKALVEGGLKVLEITLRTDSAMQSIGLIKNALPDAIVGAGTVNTLEQLQQCADAKVDFLVSPGFHEPLLHAATAAKIPYLPAAATAGEVLRALNAGLDSLKFFPAEAAGGIPMLKSLAGPYTEIQFCPTGGINEGNVRDYLKLSNVTCVGGSWVAPGNLIKAADWDQIRQLAQAASAPG